MNGLTSTLPHPPWRWRENILQLLPDAVVPSKDELAAYWHTVAQKALRYLARRPLKLVRHTRGTTFYHKSRLLPVPIASISCASRSAKAATACASGFTARGDGRRRSASWAATVDDIQLADRVGFRQPKPSRKKLAVKLEPATR